MTFSIRSQLVAPSTSATCELVLGDHYESFPLITSLWSREAYEAQWTEALSALVSGAVKSCALMTDIQPPEDSVGVSYWALFRQDDLVYLQERFLRASSALLVGPPISVEAHIPPRIQGTTEEQSRVSEWTVALPDIREFLKK